MGSAFSMSGQYRSPFYDSSLSLNNYNPRNAQFVISQQLLQSALNAMFEWGILSHNFPITGLPKPVNITMAPRQPPLIEIRNSGLILNARNISCIVTIMGNTFHAILDGSITSTFRFYYDQLIFSIIDAKISNIRPLEIGKTMISNDDLNLMVNKFAKGQNIPGKDTPIELLKKTLNGFLKDVAIPMTNTFLNANPFSMITISGVSTSNLVAYTRNKHIELGIDVDFASDIFGSCDAKMCNRVFSMLS